VILNLTFCVLQDLEEQKQHNKQAIHDRMVAVARAKDQIRNEMSKEIEKITEKMKQVCAIY